MAYASYDGSKPDAAAYTRQVNIDGIRDNLSALRDMAVTTGTVAGFNFSIDSGTEDQPTVILYKRFTRWIKIVRTYGTSGVTNGLVTKVAYYISNNSGTSYDPMADAAGYYVCNFGYSATGRLITTTWGATP